MIEHLKRLKWKLVLPGDPEDIENMEIRGRDLLTGLPKTIEITAEEIAKALHDTVYAIVDAVKNTLKRHRQNLQRILWIEGLC